MDSKHHKTLQQAYQSGLLKTPQLILMAMANRRRRGWKLSDLAKALGMKPSLLSMSKASLLETGLVTEHYPQRDTRVVRLYLTDLGHEKASELWKALQALASIEKEWRNTDPPPWEAD